MSELSGVISRLVRRILLMIGRGRVTTGNDAGNVQKLQVKLSDFETIDDLPRLAEFGFTSNPPIGSDAVVIFIGGERSNGVIVATGHQSSRQKSLQPGEMKIYSQDGKYIYLTASSGITIEANNQAVTVNNAASLTINSAGDITMNTPLLKVSGDIIDNFGSNSHNMSQMRSIYNTHTHPVHSVQSGSDTVTTNVPNQLE